MIRAAAAKASSSGREYSIFVGNLTPETSESDLLAVFLSPILGLRRDRPPKVVKPFYSAKSAKIMFDPFSGASKGYGFVR
jgi:RNA recognition motif-containing protein